MKESKKLTRITALILTVIFLGFVFAAFFTMLAQHHKELVHSVLMTPELKATLPEHPDKLDRLAARINGFTAAIAENMWLKDEMGHANSAFQYALGKRVINTGSQNMVKLTDGHLYDLCDYKPLEGNARDIVNLRNTAFSGLPFLFVYEHPTLYRDDMLPSGYEALDHSAQMADEVLTVLKDGGIDILDSRDVLTASGRDLNDLLMVTDQHWSTLAAITMAQSIAERLNETAGTHLDASLLDLENFDTLTHEKLFLGKYGQRLGTGLVDPDDIIEYWPKYDTHIQRETKRVVSIDHAEGTFREAVTRFDRLQPDPGKTYNLLAYTYYGQVEAYDLLTNESAPDTTILLLKDSYSAPIGTFLSLTARHVLCVDLRRDVQSLDWWLDTYHPDAVVMAYSLQMLRDDEYEFG